MRYMRVLQINKFFYRRGGAETHFLDLCGLLKSRGHEVIHFSTADSRNEPSPYSAYFVPSIDLRAKHGLLGGLKVAEHILYSCEAARQLEQLIKDTRPDIAHLHNIYHHLSPSILLVLKKYEIPVIMTLHDYKLICPNYKLYTQGEICERCKKHKYYQAILHRCIFDKIMPSALAALEMSIHKFWGVYEKNIDLFISPSIFLKNKLLEWGIEKKIEVIPNFISSFESLRATCLPDRQERSNLFGDYLLYFGRLSEEKGLLTLIWAMKNLPDVQLRIVGDGPLKEKLQNLADKPENVQLVGYKSGDELAQEIVGARAVVIPSEWYENYPVSILEAMNYGKPIIAANIGGLLEIVRDGVSGLLFQPGNANYLVEKIKLLCNSVGLARTLGQAGQKQVSEENNQEAYYKRILAVYQGLI
ncbi:MAG: group 1 glycosyl transferase [Candidatus Magasanikbacteria bacterium GW2011_GWC2_41_17]|uniref:Group 1 glycosyl transferase n=1 Tax=Candidatus Magasanikbacteria bacterium GW2011_GWC2_41_17 TaxID=1619048 RepID=A0A0G0XLV7_9BACT|nr:MAG: group 1 glycosyl transferase [Candidatus Magasanikbacteria bacterium GW2011_GWC2_41_17]HBX16116.1 hypothetical protein [Candidatus Magasanikbacteria bacterium]